NSIKYGKKGTGKRARPGRPGTASEAIRLHLDQNPQAKPREIRAAMADQGVTASLALISKVKHRLTNASRSPRMRVAARLTGKSNITLEQLIEVKRLAITLGGLDQVRRAVEALEQLR